MTSGQGLIPEESTALDDSAPRAVSERIIADRIEDFTHVVITERVYWEQHGTQAVLVTETTEIRRPAFDWRVAARHLNRLDAKARRRRERVRRLSAKQ